MSFESAFDRLSMVASTDWGTSAVYQNRKTRFPIVGIFDNNYQGVDVAEVEFASSTPILTIPTATLPCKPVVGDFVIINCRNYTVRNFRADGTGMTVLHLEYMTELEIATVNNLLLQDGSNMLLENGGFILLEVSN
jgi:hypothetical protein